MFSLNPLILAIYDYETASTTLAASLRKQPHAYELVPLASVEIASIKQLAPQVILLFGKTLSSQLTSLLTQIREEDHIQQASIILVLEDIPQDAYTIYRTFDILDSLSFPYDESALLFKLDQAYNHAMLRTTHTSNKMVLDALMHYSPYLVWCKDTGNKYTLTNDAFAQACGKPLESIYQQVDTVIWDDKLSPTHRHFDALSLETLQSVLFDDFLPTKEGKKLFNICKTPLVSPQGNPVGIMAIGKDITELKHKDATLQILMDNIPFGVCLKDMNGCFLNMNTSYAKDLGGVPSDFVGKCCKDLVPQLQYLDTIHQDQAICEQKKALLFEVSYTNNGHRHIYEVHKMPVFDMTNNVIGIVSLLKDVTDLRETEKAMHSYAYRDTLTGLHNRRSLYEYMERKSPEEIALTTLLFLDLDDFKQLNDSRGHLFGDTVLTHISNIILETTDNAFTARLGGDEFIILLEGYTKSHIISVCETLLNKIGSRLSIDDQECYISASMGAVQGTEPHTDVEDLIMKADMAMYKSKNLGKNRFLFYTDGMENDLLLHINVTQDLRFAIENDEIHLMYQPQYTAEGELIGFEALFRWHNPKYSQTPVNEIINIMETSSLIHEIGDYILEQSFVFAKKVNALSPKPLYISINISPVQLTSPNFVHRTKKLMKNIGVNPKHLCFEITESVFLENMQLNKQKLQTMKDWGCYIALDDFGTGYSSFSYLVNLPISTVKIDRSFVWGLSKRDEFVKLTNLVIDAAHTLGLSTVAEGVETQDQLDMLREMEIDSIQGYYFAKPLSEADALARATAISYPL